MMLWRTGEVLIVSHLVPGVVEEAMTITEDVEGATDMTMTFNQGEGLRLW